MADYRKIVSIIKSKNKGFSWSLGASEPPCDLGTTDTKGIFGIKKNNTSYGVNWDEFKNYAKQLGYEANCDNFKNMPKPLTDYQKILVKSNTDIVDDFWKEYPRKIGKFQARKSFEKYDEKQYKKIINFY